MPFHFGTLTRSAKSDIEFNPQAARGPAQDQDLPGAGLPRHARDFHLMRCSKGCCRDTGDPCWPNRAWTCWAMDTRPGVLDGRSLLKIAFTSDKPGPSHPEKMSFFTYRCTEFDPSSQSQSVGCRLLYSRTSSVGRKVQEKKRRLCTIARICLAPKTFLSGITRGSK